MPRFVKADAAEIDREVVFQAPDDDLKDATRILALADSARGAINIAGYILKSNVGPQCSSLARFVTEYREVVRLPD